jgi:hypothetical protein
MLRIFFWIFSPTRFDVLEKLPSIFVLKRKGKREILSPLRPVFKAKLSPLQKVVAYKPT